MLSAISPHVTSKKQKDSIFKPKRILKIKVPKDLNTQFKVFNWIKSTYLSSVKNKVSFFQKQLDKFGISSSKIEEFKKITKHLN